MKLHYPFYLSLTFSFLSVTNRLQELEHSSLEDAGRSAHVLQYRSLRLLSPPTKVKEPKANSKNRASQSSQTRTKSPAKRSSPSPERHDDQNESLPTRRIRRPVMIRRPKLVGKSIDGAAMQAVAASRKRASSNQFKNVANAVPARRPSALTPLKEAGRNTVIKSSPNHLDSGSKRFGRPPTLSRRQMEGESDDDDATLIKTDFQTAYLQKYWQLRRESSLQREATLLLSNIWLPRQPDHTIPVSVAAFIMSKSPMAWTDACRFPPFPSGLMDGLVPIFARWIATFTPGIHLLSTTTSRLSQKSSSILLVSNTKNVRGRKCLVVVKISKTTDKKAGPIVRCQGWVSVLARRSRRDQITKPNANLTSATFLEKDSAGLNKLSADLHVS